MNYIDILKEKNLKATPQRICVLKMLDKKEHPTMDTLYSDIKKEHPSVSLATVYKNVNVLKEHGAVVEINMPNGKMRYDIVSKPHVHVGCCNCGSVQDLMYDENLFNYEESLREKLGQDINRLEVVVCVSTCKECNK